MLTSMMTTNSPVRQIVKSQFHKVPIPTNHKRIRWWSIVLQYWTDYDIDNTDYTETECWIL